MASVYLRFLRDLPLHTAVNVTTKTRVSARDMALVVADEPELTRTASRHRTAAGSAAQIKPIRDMLARRVRANLGATWGLAEHVYFVMVLVLATVTAGCAATPIVATKPATRDEMVVLLPGRDGAAGTLTVDHEGQQRTLDAPYTATRRAVREMIEAYGAFVEVHVATSIEECERRDRKGLYKLAREGKIKEFTGISDPYEVPEKPELRVETEGTDVDGCAHQVILKLEGMGLIKA